MGEAKTARGGGGGSSSGAKRLLPYSSRNPCGTSTTTAPVLSKSRGLGLGWGRGGAEASSSSSLGHGMSKPTKTIIRGDTRLTEGNIARQQVHRGLAGVPPHHDGGGGGIMAGGGGRMVEEFIGDTVGSRVAGKGEVGGLERVRRYMETRHGERAARETRCNDVTRSLLQTL